MKTRHYSIALGTLLGTFSVANATIVGFGELGGNNATVPSGLASNATANGNGFVISNGATPNIALTWDSGWDIHTSTWFNEIENLTVGGGNWDNEGSIPRIGQLDFGTHTIDFAVDAGYKLVLNSFDFGHTAETTGTTEWKISLTDSSSTEVWLQVVTLNNADSSRSVTIMPGFTGTDGGDYTLTFTRTSETYSSNGRHALDNLNFNQVAAIPEPSTAALLGCAATLGLVVLGRRRRK